MSRLKVQNRLQDEIMQKIAELMDKPISVKSTKQIIDAISHPSSPKQKILSLLINKNRGQLILLMIQNYAYLFSNQQLLNDTLNNLQKNMTKYSYFQIVISIWKAIIKMIFTKLSQNKSLNQRQQLVYRLGYENLFRQGIKVANLQKKDKIFQLIYCNIILFRQLGLKDNLRRVIVTYLGVFIKFPITVLYYVKVLALIINMVRQSQNKSKSQNTGNQNTGNQNSKKDKESKFYMKQNKNKVIGLQKLPQISNQYLTQIIYQLNSILLSTTQKPLHSLHNQCLIVLVSVLNYSKQSQQILNNNLIYSLKKTLETFLYRKATRDQARKLSLLLIKTNQLLQKANQQKMIKQYSQLPHSNITEKIHQKPVLIENVINKTNQYLVKYHVNEIVQNINKNQKMNQTYKTNSKFLKKGQGVGGGRTALQIDIYRLRDKQYKQQDQKLIPKKKDRFELLLQNCLMNSQWQQQNKNNQQARNDNRNDYQYKQKQRSNCINKNKDKMIKEQKKNSQQFYQSIFSQFCEQLPNRGKHKSRQQKQLNQDIYQQRMNKSKKYENKYQYCQEQEEKGCDQRTNKDSDEHDVDEINQLIELAYSYKFGKI